MMMMRSVTFALAVGGGLAAAACSNDTSTTANLPCGAPKGQVALAYPAPGATGIPDNFPGVVFASTNGLTSGYEAVVVASGSSQGQLLLPVAPAPSPLPSPYAAPSFGNPIYQESASNGLVLPAATQIAVYLNDGNSDCRPTTVLGTFTTQ